MNLCFAQLYPNFRSCSFYTPRPCVGAAGGSLAGLILRVCLCINYLELRTPRQWPDYKLPLLLLIADY